MAVSLVVAVGASMLVSVLADWILLAPLQLAR